MNLKGHVGLTLLALSSLMYIFDFRSYNYLLMVLLATALSSLPDIDIRLELPHRKYTHNVFVALIVSIGFGYLTYILLHDFSLGFTPMFAAFILHIIGDLMTYKPFKPLAPFQRRASSFRLFRSSNKYVNNGLLILGILIFFIYAIYVFLGLRIGDIVTYIQRIIK
ncbi:MAG: hypothetical protein B6U85_04945 [Desulfurococcales archaeon ex4484_42]|nr:MAG: hypothetical protein B6U85_04945 [Desulfurococcales archaeon ex4484_42]